MAMLCLLLLTGGAQSLAAAPAEGDLYAEAESRYLGRNYAAALESYDAFLAAYPQSERVSDVQVPGAPPATIAWAATAMRCHSSPTSRPATAERATFPTSPCGKDSPSTSWQAIRCASRVWTSSWPGPRMPSSPRRPSCTRHLRRSPSAATSRRCEPRRPHGGLPGTRVFPYAAVLRGSVQQSISPRADLLGFTQKIDPAGFPDPWKAQFLLLKAEALWQSGRPNNAQPFPAACRRA